MPMAVCGVGVCVGWYWAAVHIAEGMCAVVCVSAGDQLVHRQDRVIC
jgi:hypothetical protein